MPYLEQNELVRLKDEAAKVRILNETIESKDSDLEKYKKQRTFLLGVAIVGLLATVVVFFSFSPNNNEALENYLNERNLDTINADTLKTYQGLRHKYNNLLANQMEQPESTDDSGTSFEDQEVVYSVQLGAYEDFNIELISENFTNLAEKNISGINKYSIGNFPTYEEVYMLKQDLIKLGFKDCFVITQSYGKEIDVREALALSGEEEKY
ncbi:SPOR domain-containing protein [Aureivirga sp. CE67]|uniref:SPOR domain-containing protein n=1 Tax=Aureivirga sp. CE67 TaxID=1788983 RepID=UPI0018CB28CA|nr:SPOR domain-containing protein [Aureivirga sp. CE67]